MIRITANQAAQLLRFLSGTTMPMELAETLKNIHEQMSQPNHHSELVDVVADLLQNSYGRVALTGSLLSRLREAVLSPSEFAKVQALKNSWAGCAHCGKKLSHYEIVTLVDREVLCYSCATPSMITCPTCHTVNEYPSTTITRVVKKAIAECHGCASGKTKPPDEVIEDRSLGGGIAEAPQRRNVRVNPTPAPPRPTWETIPPPPPQTDRPRAISFAEALRIEQERERERSVRERAENDRMYWSSSFATANSPQIVVTGTAPTASTTETSNENQ